MSEEGSGTAAGTAQSGDPAGASQHQNGEGAERLAQQEQYIDHLKGELGGFKQREEQMREKLAQLEGRLEEQSRLSAQNQAGGGDEYVSPYELTEEQQEQFNAEPAAMVKFMEERQDEFAGRMLQLVKGVMAQQDERWQSVEQTLEERSPERLRYAEKIAKLQEDPAFEGFSADQLLVVAKREDTGSSAEEYVGSGGGGSRPPAQSAQRQKQEWDEEHPACKLALEMANGNVDRAKAIFNRAQEQGEV